MESRINPVRYRGRQKLKGYEILARRCHTVTYRISNNQGEGRSFPPSTTFGGNCPYLHWLDRVGWRYNPIDFNCNPKTIFFAALGQDLYSCLPTAIRSLQRNFRGGNYGTRCALPKRAKNFDPRIKRRYYCQFSRPINIGNKPAAEFFDFQFWRIPCLNPIRIEVPLVSVRIFISEWMWRGIMVDSRLAIQIFVGDINSNIHTWIFTPMYSYR